MDNQENVRRDGLTPSGPPVPPQDGSDLAQEEAPATLGQWFAQNGVSLAIVAALLVFLFSKFDTAGLLAIGKAALGLSLVVFIHELGHFLAAKWCDVHVTTFSIGFGPSIPGCHFRWGETTYKLGLIPLGGYVQMVGQVDGDESSDGSEDDPRSYRNKTVGQRMLIISAGVIMNVLLAFLCFVLVFRGPGKDRQAAVFASVETGSPAFVEGMRTGDQVLSLGETRNPTFDDDLMFTVKFTTDGERLHFVQKRAGDDQLREYDIEPLKKRDYDPMIGVAPAGQPQLIFRRYVGTKLERPAFPGTPADKATPALRFGDRIVATGFDAEDPAALKDLPADPRLPSGTEQRDFFEFQKRLQRLAGKPFHMRVRHEDEGGETGGEEVVVVPPAFAQSLGVRMKMGQITAVRKDSPASMAQDLKGQTVPIRAGELDPRQIRYLGGDVIEAVEVPEAGGGRTRFEGPTLDPERLPLQLRDWADRIDRANTARKEPDRVAKKVTLQILRKSKVSTQEDEKKTLVLDWDSSWKYDQFNLLFQDSPLPIPELGLAYQIKATVAGPRMAGEQAQKSKLQAGDEIRKLRYSYLDTEGEEKKSRWISLENEEGEAGKISLDNWAYVAESLLQNPNSIKSFDLVVSRYSGEKAELKELEVVPEVDESWPIIDRGFLFMKDLRNQRASSILGAIGMGLRDTHRNMMRVYSNLRGLMLKRLSVERNLGGPLRIGELAYRVARFDFWEFIFFLGLISINLAVINFLPIPVLDGGHMVFLLYEKFRGKPASEGVRVGATYLGLVLILCLMGFVLFLDISHYFR